MVEALTGRETPMTLRTLSRFFEAALAQLGLVL
jgi:hypothetical protein